MEAKLTVVGGKTNKKEISLPLPITIGRGRECRLTVGHPMISRRHCELFEVGGVLMVRDLGSLNGTTIAGERITKASLRPGGEFTVGPVTFRVDYEYHGDPAAIPAAPPAGAAAAHKADASEPLSTQSNTATVEATHFDSAAPAANVAAKGSVTPTVPASEALDDDDFVCFALEDDEPQAKPSVPEESDDIQFDDFEVGEPKAAADKKAQATPSPAQAKSSRSEDTPTTPAKNNRPTAAAPVKEHAKAAAPSPAGKNSATTASPPAGQQPAKKKAVVTPAPKKEPVKSNTVAPAQSPAKSASPAPAAASEEAGSSSTSFDDAFEDFLKGVQ